MKYVGLIFTILFFTVVLLLILLYLVLVILKKYDQANRMLSFCFLSSFVSIMALSWSLIMINEGSFDIIFTINVNYTYTLIITIPIILMIIIADFFVRKNSVQKSAASNFARYLEPVLFIVLFVIITVIFYFNCNYFQFKELLIM